MTRVVDLHPEELLDRDARAELTAAEQTRLHAHLARCAACRFERQLRADFTDELEGDEDDPSLPSVERLALLGTSLTSPAKRALAGEPARKAEGVAAAPASREEGRKPVRRRMTRATWLFAAAALFAVSIAAASDAGQRAWSRILGEPSPFVPNLSEIETATPVHASAKHTARRGATSAPASSASGALAALAASPALDVLDTVVPSAPAPVAIQPAPLAPAPFRPVAAANPTPRVSHRLSAKTAPSTDRAPGPRDSAASLFEAAADARRQGSYARAVDLQRELLSRYPASRESHVARETLGRLLLDRGDPAGAVSSFDAYLAEGSGELGEEAMVGRATALERLGRSAQASDAWRALLAAYPETAYAAHAKSRLGSLSVR